MLRWLSEFLMGPEVVIEEPGKDPTREKGAWQPRRLSFGKVLLLLLFILFLCSVIFWSGSIGASAFSPTLTSTPTATATTTNTPTATSTVTISPTTEANVTSKPHNPVPGNPRALPTLAPLATYTPAPPQIIIQTQVVREQVQVPVTRISVVVQTVVQTQPPQIIIQTRIVPITSTPMPTYTPPPTQTPWVVYVTVVATATYTTTPTETPTATATLTLTPTATATLTSTAVLTDTPTTTPTATLTATP